MKSAVIFQLLPYWVKNIISSAYGFKLIFWRKSKRKNLLNMLLEREKWTAIEYESYQLDQLTSILEYARNHVPYYKSYWDSQSNCDYLELGNWPILDKEAIRNNPELFISEEYNKSQLLEIHTSGSTGKPMVFWMSRDCQSFWYAMYERRIKIWNGVSESDAYGAFGGKLIVSVDKRKSPFWVWNLPMRQLYFSSYHIDEETAVEYIGAMFQYKLKYLLGYTSSIYNIAKFAKDKQVNTPSLKLVITNAEPLMDHQRDLIQEVFNCRVIQTYSGSEYAFGGSEDLSGKMYLWPEAGVMEVLNDNNDISSVGTGEFIVTGFLNKAMPLIRYRVGDYGTVCAPDITNSRVYKYIANINGRTDDLLKSPDGRIVGRLDPIFKMDLNIIEAQIIQESLTQFTINIVPTEFYSDIEGQELMNRLKERVGKGIFVQINKVAAIPRGANGKFKSVISRLE
jgi:phenylacetate-CoA ligase